MKRKTMMVLSGLAIGLQTVCTGALAQGVDPQFAATTFPADAEEPYVLAARDSYAERRARMGDAPAAWGVSPRDIGDSPFPQELDILDD